MSLCHDLVYRRVTIHGCRGLTPLSGERKRELKDQGLAWKLKVVAVISYKSDIPLPQYYIIFSQLAEASHGSETLSPKF